MMTRKNVWSQWGYIVFYTDLLKRTLIEQQQDKSSNHDFGQDILPKLLKDYSVQAYNFGNKQGRVTPDRYWRDVGTIDAYYQANMDLHKPVSPLNLYQHN